MGNPVYDSDSDDCTEFIESLFLHLWFLSMQIVEFKKLESHPV